MSTTPIMDRIKGFLDAQDWSYEENPEHSALFSAVGFGDTDFAVVFAAHEDVELLLFYISNPVPVAPESRQKVAEFLTRANYQLYFGSFEMDFNDGEIRYRTTADVEGIEWGERLFHNLVGTGVRTMQSYHEALIAVATTDITPAAALEQLSNEMAEVEAAE